MRGIYTVNRQPGPSGNTENPMVPAFPPTAVRRSPTSNTSSTVLTADDSRKVVAQLVFGITGFTMLVVVTATSPVATSSTSSTS